MAPKAVAYSLIKAAQISFERFISVPNRSVDGANVIFRQKDGS
jgi:hypothetical protein